MSPTLTEPREYGDHDLAVLVERSAGPLVVESYHAGWESPWRGLSADAWRELSSAFGDRVEGAAVETGKNREAAARYGLEIIPTVLVFLHGRVVARFTGTVRVAAVIEAVHAALSRSRTLESARHELEAVSASRDLLSPVRSILRRRTGQSPERSLARAG